MRSPLRSVRPDVVALGREREVVLVELIGRSSTATVHRGVLRSEAGLERRVAVKTFAPVSSDDEAPFAEAVARTARRSACIMHPNVVSVLDVGVVQGAPFLVSELVDGAPLSELVARYAERRSRPPLEVALFVGVEIANALEGARTARDLDGTRLGVVHLGLTPSNVLLSFRGEVKVTDFELSLARAATSSVRDMSELRGRIAYLPPEIAEGSRGDARTDVFALGLVLRELLVGARFPPGVGSSEAIRLARDGYLHPHCFEPNLPAALTTILQRALEVDPGRRFPNAGALAFELRRVAMSMGVADGRWFLRRTLERELADEPSEVTREFSSAPPDPDD